MPLKQVIVVRQDLKMGAGKKCAQCSHASVAAFLKAQKQDPEGASEWLETGMAKIVLKVNSKKELVELFENAKKRFPCALVHDAGRTQLAPGEITCLGIGPSEESQIDGLTGGLKLL